MLIGHTDETCPIIIFIIEEAAQRVKICAHSTFGCGEKTNRTQECAYLCVCACFSLLTRRYYLISADMFFLQRLFISHPAPPLNTSLIVPIDRSPPAKRSRNTLTCGLMFDWLSVWQPILQPCHTLSSVIFTVSRILLRLSQIFFSINWVPSSKMHFSFFFLKLFSGKSLYLFLSPCSSPPLLDVMIVSAFLQPPCLPLLRGGVIAVVV